MTRLFEIELPYQGIPICPYATVPLDLQHEWKAKTALELYKKIGEIAEVEDVYEGFVPSLDLALSQQDGV